MLPPDIAPAMDNAGEWENPEKGRILRALSKAGADQFARGTSSSVERGTQAR